VSNYTCPNGCDLKGAPIPEESFDPKYHELDPEAHDRAIARWGSCHCLPYGDKPPESRFFSRVIGIYDWDKDRTVAWQCPDCGVRWDR